MTTTIDPLPLRTLHQFPKPTWIENLAVRKNGQLLLTLLTTPEIYLLDPSKPSEPVLLHSFTGYLGLLGITEVGDDVFYVAAGDFNIATFNTGVGSYAVWEVDLRESRVHDGTASGVKTKKIVGIPEAVLFNGMETIPGEEAVLIADSGLGVVWKVDIQTGTFGKFADAPEMKPPAQGFPIGINGIKIHDGYLYWSNSGLRLFCRIAIGDDSKTKGEVEIVKELFTDDFVFDKEGNAWLAQNVLNTIGVEKKGGSLVTVAGKIDELTVAGPTACQFGRRHEDKHILYVATTGGIGAPVNGTESEGGKVIAVDTTKFKK